MPKTAQMTPKKLEKILIAGAYGVDNWGDELILQQILTEIRPLWPAAKNTVLSGNPARTAELHKIETDFLFPIGRGFFKWRQLRAAWKRFSETDIFMLGGGGLFQDHEPRSIFLWGAQLLVAKLLRKPTFVWAVSVGPLRSRFSRWCTKWFLRRADFITVRDQRSRQLLEKMGISAHKITVTADPALLLPDRQISGNKKRVVFALRPSRFLDTKKFPIVIARFVGMLVRQGFQPEFIAMQSAGKNADPRFAMQLAQNFPVFIPKNFEEVVHHIARAKLVVGMRLHSLMIAATQQVPFLALSYSPKVTSFCEELGAGAWVLPAETVSFEKLRALFKTLPEQATRIDTRAIIKRARHTKKIFQKFVQDHGFLE